MSAAASLSSHQRAQGALHIAFKRRDALSVLDDLRQEGCLKARFPRPVAWPEAVLLNSSGGIAGGDRLNIKLDVGAGAQASFTAQAAERFYRALPEDAPSTIRTTLRIAESAAAEWLPQESILFDHSALDRRLDITMAESARLTAVETLVLGRRRSGETVIEARIADTITITCGPRLLLHDAIRMHGPIATLLTAKATANAATSIATLIHVAPDAESLLEPLRAAWKDAEAETGASAWDGMLIGRILAPEGASLRAAILAALPIFRGSRPLPRVWNC